MAGARSIDRLLSPSSATPTARLALPILTAYAHAEPQEAQTLKRLPLAVARSCGVLRETRSSRGRWTLKDADYDPLAMHR